MSRDIVWASTAGAAADRRDHQERRRSARGLFEMRARRQGITGDRRQSPRSGGRVGHVWDTLRGRLRDLLQPPHG